MDRFKWEATPLLGAMWGALLGGLVVGADQPTLLIGLACVFGSLSGFGFVIAVRVQMHARMIREAEAQERRERAERETMERAKERTVRLYTPDGVRRAP